jgi:hypothetical protein
MPLPYLHRVKNVLVLAALLLSLQSCKKMALQHTCTCTLQRSINGVQEDLGTLSEKQIGSYSTASDTCARLQDQYTYTKTGPEGTEFRVAFCEID